MKETLRNVINAFGINSSDFEYQKIKKGHINDTFKIYSADKEYILQKINTKVFAEPEKVMHNIEITQSFLLKGLSNDGINPNGRLPVYLNSGRKNYYINDGFWRIYKYINGNPADNSCDNFYDFGVLLGKFHRYTQNADISKLFVTIKNFHDIEKNISSAMKFMDNSEKKYYFDFLELYRNKKSIFSPSGLVHNDVKWGNVIVNPITNIPIALIDFDTVMSGNIAFDFGDAVRSSCISSDNTLNLKSLSEFSKGYFSEFSKLSAEECSLGIISIAAELSARYFKDFSSDENYFKNLTNTEKYQKYNSLKKLSENAFGRLPEIINVIKNSCGKS